MSKNKKDSLHKTIFNLENLFKTDNTEVKKVISEVKKKDKKVNALDEYTDKVNKIL